MKIIGKPTRGAKTRVVTLRLPEDLMKEIDRAVERSGISRQSLVTRMLRHAIDDKKLVIKA